MIDLHKNTKLSLISLFLAAGIFAVDTYYPLNGVSTNLYLLLIFFSLWAEDSLFTISTLTGVSFLMFINLLGTHDIELMNRFFALVVVWITTIISIQRIEVEAKLKGLSLNLELQVLGRTIASENRTQLLEKQIKILESINSEGKKEAFDILDSVINNLKELAVEIDIEELENDGE